MPIRKGTLNILLAIKNRFKGGSSKIHRYLMKIFFLSLHLSGLTNFSNKVS